MSTGVSCRVLGPLTVEIDGNLQPLGGPKQRAVFAALVLARGRTVSAQALANAVWNGDPPANYSATLHVFIAGYRKLFRDAGLDPKSVLVTAAPGYRLAIDTHASDLARFDHAIGAARSSARAGQFADASRSYRKALDEFTGDVLGDLRGLAFADEFAAAVDDQRLDATTGWAAAEIECGRASTIIPELSTLARAHPLREPLWAQLIAALYSAGRQSDALDACRRLRETLADDLGIDPSPTLQELEARVLRQESLAPLPSAAAMAATMIDDAAATDRGQLRDAAGRTWVVPTGGLHLGRMPDNEIVIDGPTVSRYHAVVSATAEGFVIRDLRSSNGTHLSGERIAELASLTDGDVITIGTHTFTFETCS